MGKKSKRKSKEQRSKGKLSEVRESPPTGKWGGFGSPERACECRSYCGDRDHRCQMGSAMRRLLVPFVPVCRHAGQWRVVTR